MNRGRSSRVIVLHWNRYSDMAGSTSSLSSYCAIRKLHKPWSFGRLLLFSKESESSFLERGEALFIIGGNVHEVIWRGLSSH